MRFVFGGGRTRASASIVGMRYVVFLALFVMGCGSTRGATQAPAPTAGSSALTGSNEVAPTQATPSQATPTQATPTQAEEAASIARAPGSAYCSGDGCPALPPPCALGEVQSVTGPGGCWNGCVPLTQCGCTRDEDCAGSEGSVCFANGRCGYDCHTAVRSPIDPVECPEGHVLSVVHATWGPCVPASACGCTSDAECPQLRGYSELCYAAGHCGPAL